MFGWEYPPIGAGGLATATAGLVQGLLRRGVEVTLVVPFPIDAAPADTPRIVSAAVEPAPALRTLRVASPLTPYGGAAGYAVTVARGTAPEPDLYGADLFTEVQRYALVAAGIAAREPHDVIDTHDWMTFAAGMRARAVSGRPFVAHIHATEADRAGVWGNPEIARREQEGLLAADRVISNSRTLGRQVVRRYGVAPERVDVVHWGIEPRRDVPPPMADPFSGDAPIVLFLGRVTWQKGPGYFVDVARRVLDFLPRARFIVAGEGDLVPQVIERALALGIAHRIHFTGALERDEVEQVLALADVCVMPSVSEPFGLVALESLRAGTPCLVPRDSGVAEVLRHALTIDFWDIDEMTNKIVALARYPALHDELSWRGFVEVHSPAFSLEGAARRTEAAYRRALEAQRDG